MPIAPNRWRVVVIRSDGSAGVSFYCVTRGQMSMVCLALRATGQQISVEEFAA